MRKEQYYTEFCTGCGLCQNCGFTELKKDKKGLMYPANYSVKMQEFCDRVCPMSKSTNRFRNSKNIWGAYKGFYTGYSLDSIIRFRASSGGVITAICCYLINNKIVDGIIHTTVAEDPTDTITVVSKTAEEIISRCGSRYSKSSPLLSIDNLVDKSKKYAFVGKPCDVSALVNYLKINPELVSNIVYKFSFFCAGTPTQEANDTMLSGMGCRKESCKSINYRGNGWPGCITVKDDKGVEYKLDYKIAWMDYLGRDIRYSCKFCFDSIGEYSDISCGDYWYLGSDNKPDMSEHDGINCILSWSDNGEKLLKDIQKEGEIYLEESNIAKLKYSQPNHANRRSTSLSRALALKVMRKNSPKYSIKLMLHNAKYSGVRAHYYTFKGTISRFKRNKL